jgi:Holliday junction resolvase RusA-like endonuclease
VIHLRLDLEPLPKLRARVDRFTGHMYTPKKTRDYEDALKMLLSINFRTPEFFLGPVSLALRFHIEGPKRKKFPVPAVRPDLDNYVKAFKDAANGVLWKDDGQIVWLLAQKVYSDRAGIEFWAGRLPEEISKGFVGE